MELPGKTYLVSVAEISTIYVGFSALLVGLRQAKGGLTKYDSYFTESFIQLGFIVAACALMPALVALYGLEESLVWRVSGVLSALPILIFVASIPRRRREATGAPVPIFVRTMLVVQASAGGLMLFVAAWSPSKAAAIYSTAVTVMLFSSCVAYLYVLDVIRPRTEQRT